MNYETVKKLAEQSGFYFNIFDMIALERGEHEFDPELLVRFARAVLKEAGVAELRHDAEQYRWLREQSWDRSALAVVSDPKNNVKLGAYCPSGELLDAAIRALRGHGS